MSDFEEVQSFVLIDLASGRHPPRPTMPELEAVLHYIEPGLVRAAVERLRVVGAIQVGGKNQVWAIPEVRYLVEIKAISV